MNGNDTIKHYIKTIFVVDIAGRFFCYSNLGHWCGLLNLDKHHILMNDSSEIKMLPLFSNCSYNRKVVKTKALHSRQTICIGGSILTMPVSKKKGSPKPSKSRAGQAGRGSFKGKELYAKGSSEMPKPKLLRDILQPFRLVVAFRWLVAFCAVSVVVMWVMSCSKARCHEVMWLVVGWRDVR